MWFQSYFSQLIFFSTKTVREKVKDGDRDKNKEGERERETWQIERLFQFHLSLFLSVRETYLERERERAKDGDRDKNREGKK